MRGASVGVDIATPLLTPSGDSDGAWLEDKAKGYLVNRERPNCANDHSFPSGHSAASSVYTRLTTLNLGQIPMNGGTREALDVGLHALSFATAWSRAVGGWHYPSDTLAAMAIGNFVGEFFTGSFMDLGNGRTRIAIAPLPAGGEVTFALAFGSGGKSR